MKITEDQMQNPGIIDVVDDSTIYTCYPELGATSDHEPQWSICRAKKIGTAWYYEWSFGTLDKIFKASDRLTLQYSFLK